MMYTLCSCSRTGVVVHKYQEDFPNADEDLCPVDYVREFVMDEEFCRILDKAKGKGSLVSRIFPSWCKKTGDDEAPIIFLKHNGLGRKRSVLPQNALLFVNFGKNTFFTISTSKKVPCLDSSIVVTQRSHKRGTSNATSKGLNLIGGTANEGGKAPTIIKLLLLLLLIN
ncbi:hypothetical protein Ahy_B02g058396 [Arachis hypogaea]|uniref:Uncharacterized protein n=1 Tax=Arachis hypogaea TaxID=3818 RepID=A0A445AEK5_ARAHY|nr:hypothetical protein Ahy_B02g058396 [Arachis hypogaea]